MNKVILGKYVNTHGIKGEIRIKSNFKYKDKVFQIGNSIIINNQDYIINSYRKHKDYDMVTLEGISDINDIPFNKNSLVYIDRGKYLDDFDYLDSDLIGFLVYNSEIEKEVLDITYLNNNKKLLKVIDGYIPFELIENIDFKQRKIKIMEVSGLWK